MAENKSDRQISEFSVSKVDCLSEEGMIRMALDGVTGVHGLAFDLGERRVQVLHDPGLEEITPKLASLDLGARLLRTRDADDDDLQALQQSGEAAKRTRRSPAR